MIFMKKMIVNLRGFVKPYYYEGRKSKYLVSKNGHVYNSRTGKEMSYAENSSGYLIFGSSDTFVGLGGPQAVHRFVAETFVPNPKNKNYVNHKDNNRKNNNADNLEWVTQSENLKYAAKQGRIFILKGEECHLTKYPDSKIREVCELLQAGYRNKDVAKMTGVDKSYISSIRNREWRKDISKYYTWDTIKFEDRRGSNAAGATITDEIARKICSYLEQGLGNKEISAKIGEPCKWWHVRNIRSRKNWTHISKDFDF